MLKIIRDKKGNVLILGMVAVTLFIFLTIFIVDVGLGYMGKVQLQTINDACVLAGVSTGAHAYISSKDGRTPYAIVIPELADPKAYEVLEKNRKYLSSRFSIQSFRINPPQVIDGKYMDSLSQYFSGNYTIKMSGRYKPFFSFSLFGLDFNIPFLNYNTEARASTRPVIVND